VNQGRRNEVESVGAMVWSESTGTDPAQSAGKKFWSYPSTFLALKEQLVVLQYSLVSFLFAVFLLTVPPCPANCKSGGHVPQCLVEWAPATGVNNSFLRTHDTKTSF